MKQLELGDDVISLLHALPDVHEEERPEGVDVRGEDGGDGREVLPVEVVELVHEVNAELRQAEHTGHWENIAVLLHWRRGRGGGE